MNAKDILSFADTLEARKDDSQFMLSKLNFLAAVTGLFHRCDCAYSLNHGVVQQKLSNYRAKRRALRKTGGHGKKAATKKSP
jgi:hypothetical protein